MHGMYIWATTPKSLWLLRDADASRPRRLWPLLSDQSAVQHDSHVIRYMV